MEETKKDFKKEEEILDHLAKAWNAFCELEREHPCELDDFCDGIHQCQRLIGMRFARDYRPDLFPIKSHESVLFKEKDSYTKAIDNNNMTHMFDNEKMLPPKMFTQDYKTLKDAAELIAKTIKIRYSLGVATGTLEDIVISKMVEAFHSK